MPNTFSVTSVVDHTTDVGYHNWVAEHINALVTQIGLTQTADTGQTANGGTVRPGVGTAGGYIILRFNDTAQATSPVFMKIEYGTGGTTSIPQIWISCGRGSDGAGNLTTVTFARSSVTNNVQPTSIITSYVSKFCWNPTLGAFSFIWKVSATGTTNQTLGGLVLARSNDGSGVVTTDAVFILVNTYNAVAGSASSAGSLQCYSYLTSALLTIPTPASWGMWPLGILTTVVGGNIAVVPIFALSPSLYVPVVLCIGLLTETPILNTTLPFALMGATTRTYLSAGSIFGSSVFGVNGALATHTLLVLFE